MLNKNSRAFTIVELLIVVVVIAILAAIVIVSYNGITQGANESAAMTAIKQASNQVKINELSGKALPADLSSLGLKDDSSIKYRYLKGNNSSWCLIANTNKKSYFTASYSDEVKEGGCNAPGANNKAIDFRFWTTAHSGGPAYDSASGEILMGSVDSNLSQPLIDVSGSKSVTFKFEVYASQSSPNQSPDGGVHTNASYFAEDGTTPAQNSLTPSYSGNGNAKPIPLNTWTHYRSDYVTGPNVKKISLSITNSVASFSGPNNRIRNVVVEIVR